MNSVDSTVGAVSQANAKENGCRFEFCHYLTCIPVGVNVAPLGTFQCWSLGAMSTKSVQVLLVSRHDGVMSSRIVQHPGQHSERVISKSILQLS